MIYAVSSGNRLDWLNWHVMALLLAGRAVHRLSDQRDAGSPALGHVNVLFSRNIGLSLVAILLYTLTSLSNSSLVPNFLSVVGRCGPNKAASCSSPLRLAHGGAGAILDLLLRHFDARAVVVLGFSVFAAANLWGTQLTHDWHAVISSAS